MTRIAACSRTLTCGACRWSTETIGTGRGVNTRAASAANSCGPEAEQHLGQQPGQLRLQGHRPGVPAGLVGHPAGEDRGDLLVRAVLQQPGEEQVARLEQREVLLVLDLAAGQQPGRLEVEQGGGDDEELGGLAEVPDRALAP